MTLLDYYCIAKYLNPRYLKLPLSGTYPTLLGMAFYQCITNFILNITVSGPEEV